MKGDAVTTKDISQIIYLVANQKNYLDHPWVINYSNILYLSLVIILLLKRLSINSNNTITNNYLKRSRCGDGCVRNIDLL